MRAALMTSAFVTGYMGKTARRPTGLVHDWERGTVQSNPERRARLTAEAAARESALQAENVAKGLTPSGLHPITSQALNDWQNQLKNMRAGDAEDAAPPVPAAPPVTADPGSPLPNWWAEENTVPAPSDPNEHSWAAPAPAPAAPAPAIAAAPPTAAAAPATAAAAGLAPPATAAVDPTTAAVDYTAPGWKPDPSEWVTPQGELRPLLGNVVAGGGRGATGEAGEAEEPGWNWNNQYTRGAAGGFGIGAGVSALLDWARDKPISVRRMLLVGILGGAGNTIYRVLRQQMSEQAENGLTTSPLPGRETSPVPISSSTGAPVAPAAAAAAAKPPPRVLQPGDIGHRE